ncbi:transposase [Mucilaginibacter sp. CSA2-8R]|uniref:transposase n=1 Tax=Mucilaginibacter sp. CSA2-8R TaxID=3141542 RepID=UPI00315D581B
MSTKYKIGNQDKRYFVSFAVVHWIDLFVRPGYVHVMLDSWQYCRRHKGLETYGWCIMSSHVHMIIGTVKNDMPDILRDMKRHTSQQLRQAIQTHPQESRREWMLWMMERAGRKNSQNTGFQLWQQDNHPIECTTHAILHQKLDYLHQNPVVAGLVEPPQDCLYSSARNYYGLLALLDVTLIDPLLV